MISARTSSGLIAWLTRPAPHGSIALLLFLSLTGFVTKAQDIGYARRIIDTLASETMAGRGYVRNANALAAEYIASQLHRNNVQAPATGPFQEFTLPINTFPGKADLTVNGKLLKAGTDFIVSATSPSVSGNFRLISVSQRTLLSRKKLGKLIKKDHSGSMILIDKSGLSKTSLRLVDSITGTNAMRADGYIVLTDRARLLWGISQGYRQLGYPVFEVLKPSMPLKARIAEVNLEAVFHPEMKVRNVLGFIPGAAVPDSFLVFTAHFDHIGMLGDVAYFPGANDNASGVAMMLDIARHYALPGNRHRYSLAFIALAAEEAGLLGSEYYVENPVFPLSQIAFLINLDMVGTGSEGITMVNGKTFTQQFDKLSAINAENEYILKVAQRGESCNSDHCPFYKKGVPAVFIYSMGKEHTEYHNIYDTADRIPLTEYEDIFRLLRDFINTF
jgi:hypothetical protein